MKGKAKKRGAAAAIGGSSGGGGIVVEATNRKARRKEQRQAKKKKHQQTLSKPHASHSAPQSSTADGHGADAGVRAKTKKKKNVDSSGNVGVVGDGPKSKRVKFSNTIQEKTIPSVKNYIPTGLKKKSSSSHNKKSSRTPLDNDDDYVNQTTSNNKNITSFYNNLDDETQAAFRKDDMEIDYLESNLGIKKSRKSNKNKELNKEYAKNEGFGDDFGDFLMGLDSLVDRCVGGGDDGHDDGEDEEESDADDDSSIGGDSDAGQNLKSINSEDDEEDEDGYVSTNEEDPYANLDEETALAFRNDDAEIAALEEKLGLSSSRKAKKKLNKEFASQFMGYGEDFGDFLEGLDELGDKIGLMGDDGGGGSLLNDDNDDESTYSDDSDDDDAPYDKNKIDDNESSRNEDSEPEEEDDSLEDTADHDVSLTYRPTSGEDIYGNKTDGASTGVAKPTKYIPPHLRKKLNQEEDASAADGATGNDAANDKNHPKSSINDTADPETIRLIQRQLNNALNRLSSQTLESVSKSISSLYAQYPFHDLNDCLWKNIQQSCIPPNMIMSGLIPLYMGAMAGVHWLGGDGIQLGGNLVEWSVVELCDLLKKGHRKVVNNVAVANNDDDDEVLGQHNQDVINKQASNLLLIVCYLYNYGVIHCTLIYDLVREFIRNFSEMDVEALLIILSHCGQQLRNDDPSALREIVLLVKDRVAQKEDFKADSSRVEYMVDTIIELKNNKPRKQDVVIREKTADLKKRIGRMKTSATQMLAGKKSGSCLRITLQDVLNAETKGRWWLVGASWAGNQYREGKTNDDTTGENDDDDDDEYNNHRESSSSKKESNKEDSLLALASSQRMNTDSRRSIFCIIMGSTDCNDAFEKLVRQSLLKPKAERDVIRVIVHCCGEEKAYNPFYAYLAKRICEYQHKSKFTLMLTFWDIFKQIETFSLRKTANLAKLLAHLIICGGSNNDDGNKCLTIGVLKRIEFSPSDMGERMVVFLSIFMSSLFESCDNVESIQAIFAHGSGARAESDSSGGGKRRRVDWFGDDEAADDDDDDGDDPKDQTTKKEDLGDLRENLSVFLLQYLKSSPKNVKGTTFSENLLAAISACEKSNH